MSIYSIKEPDMKINDYTQGYRQATLNANDALRTKALNQLASGINANWLDGASMSISDSLGSDISTNSQKIKNANDAIGYMQIAQSALSSVASGLDRLNTMSVAYNSAVLSRDQKDILQQEANSVKDGMNQSLNGAIYNGMSVFSGGVLNIGQPDLSTADISNGDAVLSLLKNVDSTRASIGSGINALLSSINSNLQTISSESQAKSTILDADISENYSQINSSLLRDSGALFAQSHSQTITSARIGELLR